MNGVGGIGPASTIGSLEGGIVSKFMANRLWRSLFGMCQSWLILMWRDDGSLFFLRQNNCFCMSASDMGLFADSIGFGADELMDLIGWELFLLNGMQVEESNPFHC